MEEEIKPSQIITIKDRKMMEIDGVKKLDSFSKKEFLIDTVNGFVHIKGDNLSLGTLDLDKGFLSLYGLVDEVSYLVKNKQDKKESFLSKLFK